MCVRVCLGVGVGGWGFDSEGSRDAFWSGLLEHCKPCLVHYNKSCQAVATELRLFGCFFSFISSNDCSSIEQKGL